MLAGRMATAAGPLESRCMCAAEQWAQGYGPNMVCWLGCHCGGRVAHVRSRDGALSFAASYFHPSVHPALLQSSMAEIMTDDDIMNMMAEESNKQARDGSGSPAANGKPAAPPPHAGQHVDVAALLGGRPQPGSPPGGIGSPASLAGSDRTESMRSRFANFFKLEDAPAPPAASSAAASSGEAAQGAHGCGPCGPAAHCSPAWAGSFHRAMATLRAWDTSAAACQVCRACRMDVLTTLPFDTPMPRVCLPCSPCCGAVACGPAPAAAVDLAGAAQSCSCRLSRLPARRRTRSSAAAACVGSAAVGGRRRPAVSGRRPGAASHAEAAAGGAEGGVPGQRPCSARGAPERCECCRCDGP